MTKYGTVALAVAGVLALSATTASAQLRGHRGGQHWGPGAIVAGIAAGALIGSAVAARPYYAGPEYYDGPVYAVPYSDGPVYVAPSYGYGYGYNQWNCSGSSGQTRDCAAGDTGR